MVWQGKSAARKAVALLVTVFLAGCGGATSSGNGAPASTPAIPTLSAAAPSATPAGPTASPLPALELLWEKSGPEQPSPCCQTWWPAVDPLTGNVWVADSFANRYWIFKPDGTFVESWGTSGSGRGQFDFELHRERPQAAGGLAFAPDGSFFVADTGNHRIQEFGPDRGFVRSWGGFGGGDGQFAAPFSVATDGRFVFVPDDDRGDVQVFDVKGRFVRTIGELTTNAGIFIALDAAGNLYRSGEAGGHVITKYDPSGAQVARFDLGGIGASATLSLVIGLAIDPAGHIYANVGAEDPNAQYLVELDASGRIVGTWSTGGETAALDPAGGAIYLAVGDGNPTWTTASLRKYALPTL